MSNIDRIMVTIKVPVTFVLLCAVAAGQQVMLTWPQEVRRCAEAHDWTGAMRIVEREINRAPQDLDVRAWRARVLAWSGKLAEAEVEYLDILEAAPNDPDNWMGLASVYSREGRHRQALQALSRAVDVDPKRADIRVARALALRVLGARNEAKLEFSRALVLDPTNAEGRGGLVSLRGETRHELRVAVNADLFSFADANHGEGLTILSKWTPHWSTTVSANGYHWGGLNAEKFVGSVTGRFPAWGALNVGGAAANDNGVIPRLETFFEYDQGFNVRRSGPLRGIETIYGQHWYWYAAARILTINETALVYLPREWTWSLTLIEARNHFSDTATEWRPAGMTQLKFPLTRWKDRRVGGNVMFAIGTENFAEVNQIGELSSHTYGGGLRFQFTAVQDVTGFAAYQRRSQNRDESSFGFGYGIRF